MIGKCSTKEGYRCVPLSEGSQCMTIEQDSTCKENDKPCIGAKSGDYVCPDPSMRYHCESQTQGYLKAVSANCKDGQYVNKECECCANSPECQNGELLSGQRDSASYSVCYNEKPYTCKRNAVSCITAQTDEGTCEEVKVQKDKLTEEERERNKGEDAIYGMDEDKDGDKESAKTDCDDNDPKRSHAFVEVFDDNIDNDCDGKIDECTPFDVDSQACPVPEGYKRMIQQSRICSLNGVWGAWSPCPPIFVEKNEDGEIVEQECTLGDIKYSEQGSMWLCIETEVTQINKVTGETRTISRPGWG